MDGKRMSFMKCGLLIGACIFGSSFAYGDLILSIESVSATPGSTGDTLDVLLTDSGSPGVSIAGFNFTIQSSNPAITFTGVFDSTATAPYIFAGNSVIGPEIDGQLTPTVTAFDFAASGSTTLNSGDVVGLGQVFFNVSSTAASGPITVSFVTSGGTADNDLSSALGDDVPISTFTSGTINVTSTPEPSSLLMILAGAGALAAWKRRRA